MLSVGGFRSALPTLHLVECFPNRAGGSGYESDTHVRVGACRGAKPFCVLSIPLD